MLQRFKKGISDRNKGLLEMYMFKDKSVIDKFVSILVCESVPYRPCGLHSSVQDVGSGGRIVDMIGIKHDFFNSQITI